MRRRSMLLGSATALVAGVIMPATAAGDSFAAALAAVTDADALATRSNRELGARKVYLVEAQGQIKRVPSKLTISRNAFDLIVKFEVSSEAYYKKFLLHPVWPGGNSGVTIGDGYDIGYAPSSLFVQDWNGKLPTADIKTLSSVLSLRGKKAKDALSTVSAVIIPWDAALAQLNEFIPYVVHETEQAFSNLADLSEDSRGALVSLVYNRGGTTDDTPRRHEMHEIAKLMAAKSFDQVPAQIRAMKHLWANAGLPGLLQRRDLEALLFEDGLK